MVIEQHNDAQRTIAETVLKSLESHVSIRRYTAEPIEDDLLLTVLNAARRSPTSSNMQAYTFVVVRDQAKKQRLSALTGNQRHVAECPVFVACCADITRLEAACAMHGKQLARNFENLLVSSVDAAIAGMTLMTAAEAHGLGAVMIGGIRNHPADVAELLGFPQGVYVVYGMCLGWPDEAQIAPQKPRLPQDLIIHYEQYDTSDPSEQLSAHDAELAAHYRAQGRKTPDAAWTQVMADKFSEPKRADLRPTLEKLGFRFD